MELGKGQLRKRVKSARFSVPLDPLVEASSFESLEPGPELVQLIGGRLS